MIHCKPSVLPSLAALSLGPVKSTSCPQAAAMGVTADWNKLKGMGGVQRRAKYPNWVASLLWGDAWHEVDKKGRLALANKILDKMGIDPKAPPPNLKMEEFVNVAKAELGITPDADAASVGITPDADASSDEDRPLRQRFNPRVKKKNAANRDVPQAKASTAVLQIPELLKNSWSDAVVNSIDPCRRIAKLCATHTVAEELCRSGELYDSVNSKLGWYSTYPSLAKLPDQERTMSARTSAKAWFMFCCDLSKRYGTLRFQRQRSESQPTITVEDLGLGVGTDYKWILDAVAGSYTDYAFIADKIEDLIHGHFTEMQEELTKMQEELKTRSADAHWDYDETETDLAFALGAFHYPCRFRECIISDSTLSVLQWAIEDIMREGASDISKLKEVMENKGVPWAPNSMPMGFYTMIYNSKKLVDVLRKSAPRDIKEKLGGEIERLFKEASLMGTWDSWFDSAGGGDIMFDLYPPETKNFMRDLLITWLYLPTLEKYVFDEGHPDAGMSGNELQYWGYFRTRRQGEEGTEVAFSDSHRDEDDEDNDEGEDDDDEDEDDDDDNNES